DQFVLSMNGFTVTVGLANTIREFNLSHDPGVVHRFANGLDGQWPTQMTWDRARPGLLYIAEPAGLQVGDSIKAPVAGKVIKVLEHWDPTRGELRFITPDDLKKWKVTRQQIDTVVESNM